MTAASERQAIAENYEQLRHECRVLPLPAWDVLDVSGGDRATFLHNFCTNDVKSLVPGKGCEAFFLSVQGKIIGHAVLLCRDETIEVMMAENQLNTIQAHLDRYIIREDVALVDQTSDQQCFLICGATATEKTRLLADPLPQSTWDHRTVEIGGITIQIAASDLTEGPSYFLIVPRAESATVLHALAELGIPAADERLFETLRVENAYPLFGRDIQPDNLPQEVGRDDQAINLNKGCYLGQETVARIDALGHVNRRLVPLRFGGDDLPPEGLDVTSGDASVGRVTSVVYSFRDRAPVALGYLRCRALDAGDTFDSQQGPVAVIRPNVGSS